MALSDKIAAMGSGYLDRTNRRLAGLLVHVGQATIEPATLDLDEVRRAFHDIVGTAPVFGFVELGASARKAEDLVIEVARMEGVQTTDIAAIRSAAERLLDQVESAQRP